MPAKTLFVVQQFAKQGRRLVAGRSIEYRNADEATARAERDAPKYAGVVALTLGIDTETGEVLEEPVVLARHGELPQEFRED